MTGRTVGVGDWWDPEYWVDQFRKPVRFADALAAVDGVTRCVELGPDGELYALDPQPDDVPAPLLRRDRDEDTNVHTALASLLVNAVQVHWSPLYNVDRP
ncbi:hypothetical protein, partial [Streptomyces sp. BE303]|uniref:hypothetical protein n=1 Tax=Streptomyces sp. BE303 TaxID=3002528 RepID=UPI002E78D537